MLSDAIGCIGFSWIASPACTGHLIFLWNKKNQNKLLRIQTFETSEYSTSIEINLFFMAKKNQITCLFRIGNGDDGLVGENVGTA